MPDEVTQALITRDEMISYMKCTDAAYHLIGEGFTDLSESKNPKEYSRKYISYKSEITDVIGYAPSYSYSCDMISGDPVVEEIASITDNEMRGVSARRDVVTVNHWVPGSTVGTFEAFKRTFAVIPSAKGSGTDALVYTGTLKAVSDVVKGSWDVATSAFTPDT